MFSFHRSHFSAAEISFRTASNSFAATNTIPSSSSSKPAKITATAAAQSATISSSLCRLGNCQFAFYCLKSSVWLLRSVLFIIFHSQPNKSLLSICICSFCHKPYHTNSFTSKVFLVFSIAIISIVLLVVIFIITFQDIQLKLFAQQQQPVQIKKIQQQYKNQQQPTTPPPPPLKLQPHRVPLKLFSLLFLFLEHLLYLLLLLLVLLLLHILNVACATAPTVVVVAAVFQAAGAVLAMVDPLKIFWVLTNSTYLGKCCESFLFLFFVCLLVCL